MVRGFGAVTVKMMTSEASMNKYAVYGWCTTEIQVLAGTIETKGLTLRETFNLASQIFIYPEGIYIRRIYDSEM